MSFSIGGRSQVGPGNISTLTEKIINRTKLT